MTYEYNLNKGFARCISPCELCRFRKRVMLEFVSVSGRLPDRGNRLHYRQSAVGDAAVADCCHAEKMYSFP